MGFAQKLNHFILFIVIWLQVANSEGHQHPHRHHHSFRKSNRFDGYPSSWDPTFHLPELGDSMALESADKPTKEKEIWEPSGNYKESHTFEKVGDSHRSKNVIKESKKDFQNQPKGSVLMSSVSFVNESNERGSVSYKGLSSYDDVYETKLSTNYVKDSDTKSKSGHSHSSEPVPAATRVRDKESPQNGFLTAPRWTLKYQGLASEQALNNTKTNVTAPAGGSAFLPCKVGHLGDRQISWIRRRDWHVLTSGKDLYSHDRRFSVLHEPGSQDWTLHIKWVDMKDAGTYECQVSTGTGIISLFVKLRVVIPEAYIPGDGQYHVDRGSSISLNCYIKNSPVPPQYILWYHNGQLLNFLRNRPDIVIKDNLDRDNNRYGLPLDFDGGIDSGLTEDLEESKKLSVSRLRVDLANDDHSGNYTCSASNTESASTLVFITEGDKTAAVQRIDSSCPRLSGNRILLFCVAIFCLVFLR